MCLNCFRKTDIVSDFFEVMVYSFQTPSAASDKEQMPKLSVILGTISYCEIDDPMDI